jgi:hypothetical protein
MTLLMMAVSRPLGTRITVEDSDSKCQTVLTDCPAISTAQFLNRTLVQHLIAPPYIALVEKPARGFT